jgi:hypothetical protein
MEIGTSTIRRSVLVAVTTISSLATSAGLSSGSPLSASGLSCAKAGDNAPSKQKATLTISADLKKPL